MRTFDVLMPSRGLLGTPDMIQLREMTLKEKKILFDKPRFEQIVNMVGDCIVDKSIKVHDLYLYDYMTLFIKLREITMGRDYEFAIRCKQCGVTQNVEIDLGELEILEASDGSTPTFDIDITDDDGTIIGVYTCKHLTVRDQIKLNKRLMKKKSGKRRFTEGDEYIFTLAYRIVAIDGEPIGDPEQITSDLENLTSSVADKIEDGMAQQDFGIRFSLAHECQNCQYPHIYPIHITSEFFFRSKDYGAAHKLIR